MTEFAKKWRVLLAALACFILFKLLFPNPDFFLDSGGYLLWGLDDYPIAFRPMGYARFLMWFRDWPDNYILLPFIHFVLFAGCTWFFNTTLFRIFAIRPKFHWIFWVLTLFNPFSWFLVNLISPDNLFLSLSALWLATLLRFLFWESRKYLWLGIHLLCFVLLFYLRYNALYYPLFAAVAVLMCRLQLPLKGLFAGCSIAVFSLLYISACDKAEELTGAHVLSGFGGWIMANNALHIYHVRAVDSNIFEEPEERMLYRFIEVFRDSVQRHDQGVTDQYMWSNAGPLKKFLYYNLQAGRYPNGYLEGWWNISTVYNDYGTKLIRHYPGAFLQSFYLPNLKTYFFPPGEVLDSFNIYHYKLDARAQEYFGYHREQFAAPAPRLQQQVIFLLKCLYAVISPLAMIAALIAVFVFLRRLVRERGRVADKRLTTAFILSSFYLITVALLAFAHPILLRYVSLPLLFFSSLPLLALIALRPATAAVFSEASVEVV